MTWTFSFLGVALVGSIVMAVLWINGRRGRSKL
jgi:hypothetical protein